MLLGKFSYEQHSKTRYSSRTPLEFGISSHGWGKEENAWGAMEGDSRALRQTSSVYPPLCTTCKSWGETKKYLEMYCFIFGWGDFHESSFSRKKHTQKTVFYQTPQIHCGHRFQVTGDFWAALGGKIVCCAVTFEEFFFFLNGMNDNHRFRALKCWAPLSNRSLRLVE